MFCPFLREATATYCLSAPLAKALLHDAIDSGSDRCTTPEHASCRYAVEAGAGAPAAARCPSLAEREVQFCAAVSSPQFIPYAAVLPSRCSTDAFRHCGLYIERTGRRAPAPPAPRSTVVTVDGIAVPLDLGYASNHLWLDRGADGTCTIGADGFLVRVIGRADRVTFVSSRPGAKPLVVLSVAGTELPLTFPLHIDRVVVNYALRVEPERLSDDPYGAGWLFEGYRRDDPAAETDPACRLLSGQAAVAWMRAEVDRLSAEVHDQMDQRLDLGLRLSADGGTFAGGLARMLRREDTLRLFTEFFPISPTTWRG